MCGARGRAGSTRHGAGSAGSGQAATAAVALTVVGALVAVVITFPQDPGKSPAPSDGSTPRATDGAQPSALPKLVVNGDLPAPSRVVVETEPGNFATVDLAVGSLGVPLVAGVARQRAPGPP